LIASPTSSLRAKRSNLAPQAHAAVARDCFVALRASRNDEKTRDERGHDKHSQTQTMVTKSLAESGQDGPCLTDAARGAALGRAVRGVPLRHGPNDATAIIAAVLARWRHVLSFVFHRASAIWENA
jgi:hypothetical protein